VKYIFLILEGKYHYYHQGKEIEDEQKQSKWNFIRGTLIFLTTALSFNYPSQILLLYHIFPMNYSV
jgi:hypothetical protein